MGGPQTDPLSLLPLWKVTGASVPGSPQLIGTQAGLPSLSLTCDAASQNVWHPLPGSMARHAKSRLPENILILSVMQVVTFSIKHVGFLPHRIDPDPPRPSCHCLTHFLPSHCPDHRCAAILAAHTQARILATPFVSLRSPQRNLIHHDPRCCAVCPPAVECLCDLPRVGRSCPTSGRCTSRYLPVSGGQRVDGGHPIYPPRWHHELPLPSGPPGGVRGGCFADDGIYPLATRSRR